jgi:hypothetical protein
MMMGYGAGALRMELRVLRFFLGGFCSWMSLPWLSNIIYASMSCYLLVVFD